MIRVSYGLCRDSPCLFPAEPVFIHKYTHEFGDSESRVGVIDMDSYLVCKVFKSSVDHHVIVYDIADRCGTEEVLLTQTEALAFKVVIVRIEYL